MVNFEPATNACLEISILQSATEPCRPKISVSVPYLCSCEHHLPWNCHGISGPACAAPTLRASVSAVQHMSAARDILVTSPPVSGWLETGEVTIARLSIGGSLLSRDGPIRGLVTFGQTFVVCSQSCGRERRPVQRTALRRASAPGRKPGGAGRAQTALALVLGRPGHRRRRSIDAARSRRPIIPRRQFPAFVGLHSPPSPTLAATNKCLAQSNKSRTKGEAANK